MKIPFSKKMLTKEQLQILEHFGMKEFIKIEKEFTYLDLPTIHNSLNVTTNTISSDHYEYEITYKDTPIMKVIHKSTLNATDAIPSIYCDNPQLISSLEIKPTLIENTLSDVTITDKYPDVVTNFQLDNMVFLEEHIKNNHLDSVKALVQNLKKSKGRQWSQSDVYSVESAFRDAILLNQIDTVQFFLDEEISPDAYAYEKGTSSGSLYYLIYFAVSTGNLPMTKLLVENGADIKPHNSYYNHGNDSAIKEAVVGGHNDIVDYLLEEGAKSNGLCYGGVLGEMHGGTTYLAKAAENKNIPMVKSLLKYGASITSAIYLADDKYYVNYTRYKDTLEYKYSQEKRVDKIHSSLMYFSQIKSNLNQINQLLVHINESTNKQLCDKLMPFFKILFPLSTDESINEQIAYLIANIREFEQEKQKKEIEIKNLKNNHENMIGILLDHAVGTDFPIEEKKDMNSGEYHGLTFLNDMDISGLNFIGVSIAGQPITRDMLIKRKLRGAEKALVTLDDLTKLDNKERQSTIQKNIEECQKQRGKLIDKNGIINLVPLNDAVQAGDINAVKNRLDAGIDPNPTEEKTSPIVLASKCGYFEIVKILAAHPKINKKDIITAINETNSKEISLYLTDLQDVDATDEKGCTLLHMAVERKDLEEIKKLIKKKANVNAINKNEQTPLSTAASMKDKLGSIIVELLLRCGADANLYKWSSPLSRAIAADNPKSVSLLLPVTEKKEIEKKDFWDGKITHTIPWYVPLMFDALDKENDIELLTLLKTANADFSNSSSGNILNKAIRLIPSYQSIISTMRDLTRGGYNRHPEAMEETYKELNERAQKYFEVASKLINFLLENGATMKLADKDGYTPLHTIIKDADLSHVKEGYKKFLELIVNQGADVNAITQQGDAPVHLAAMKGDIIALEFLASKNANLNAIDKSGRTALHIAAAKGFPETVKKLIQLGLDVDAKDSNKLTAFELCEQGEVQARNIEYYNHSTGETFVKQFDEGFLATIKMLKDKTLRPVVEKEILKTENSLHFFNKNDNSVSSETKFSLPQQGQCKSDEPVKNEKKLTIVFGIDDILAAHESPKPNDKLYLLRKSAIIVAAKTEHQIFPGIIELIQYLYSKDSINVAFFSSGTKERNVEFVKELLIKALGREKYNQIEDTLTILSKEDLTPNNDKYQSNLMHKTYGLGGGNNQKDIRKALGKNGSLNNAIFVDDDKTYVFHDQEKNFLCGRVGYVDYDYYLNYESNERDRNNNLTKYNRAFYITGVLSDCISVFEKGGDFRELLFKLQFKKSQENLFSYEFDYSPSDNSTLYYEKGLEVLKKTNPKLSFVSKEDYLTTLEIKATEKEQAFLKEVETNATNKEGCSIM